MSETGPSVKSGIARIAGAVGLAALGFGLNPAETARADDPPKTPTPTASPTPDATRTAAESALKDLEERLKREQELKAIRDKAAAVKAALDALTTPTATPNAVATAQANAFIAQREREFQAADDAKAQATTTPRPDEQGGRDPTPQPSTPPPPAGPGAGSESGGKDFRKIAKDNAGLLVGAGAAALAIFGAAKLRGRRGPGEPPSPDADLPPLPGTGGGL